jgi:hypothetical protein
MSRYRFWGSVLVVPLLAVAIMNLGCGGGATTPAPTGGGGGKGSSSSDSPKTSGAPKSGDRTPLQATGLATIKGKVTFAGDPPPPKNLTITGDNKEMVEYCHKGDTRDPSWTIDAKTKGVKNVVVWLKAPQGKYFEVPADLQKPAETSVKIGQPFCAFEPHVAVVFPSFFDGKKQKKTGQELEIINNAKIVHNTNWTPTQTDLDTGDNAILPVNGARKVELFTLKDNRPNLEDRLLLKCNIHGWMTAYVWAFDHPYAAVTKEDGSYEIKNVPAGSELYIVGWHEVADYLAPKGKGTKQGEMIDALKDKDVKEINFEISK